jgi:DNA-binding CsgD family transcriptional regulator
LRSVSGLLPGFGEKYLIYPAYYLLLNLLFLINFTMPRLIASFSPGNAGPTDSVAIAPAILLAEFSISGRETEVLRLLAHGQTYREIADSLCISLATVKTHVSHLYQKTATRNKVELLRRLRA